MKRHSIFKKIQKPNAAPVNLRVDIPQSQFINKNNFTKTCLCSCKDEVSKVADGITRLERLASVQSNLIKKIARRIHLDSDADYKAPSSHLDNTFNRRIFPITTEEGLIELDQLLQDKSVHFQVIKQVRRYWNDTNTSAQSLRLLVTENVLANFHWKGKQDRKALKDMIFFKQTLHVGLSISYFEYVTMIKRLIRLSHNLASAKRTKKKISNLKTSEMTMQDNSETSS